MNLQTITQFSMITNFSCHISKQTQYFMSNFYQRYRNLFQVNHYSPIKKMEISEHHFDRFNPKFNPFYELPHKQYANHKSKPLEKSAALYEFQQFVLPKLNKNYKGKQFRLRTDPSDVYASEGRENEYEGLMKVRVNNSKRQQRKQINKETSRMDHSFNQKRTQQILNLDSNIKQLQRQFLKQAMIPNRKHNQSANLPEDINQIYIRKRDQVDFVTTIQSANKGDKYAQRWDDKTMLTANEPTQINPQQKTLNLYGIKNNPYAFVHDKLDDIKRSDYYVPKGYINDYRAAIFRRRSCKNKIEQRRRKLQQLLNDERSHFGFL